MKLFDKSTDIFDAQIEEAFSKPKDTEMDLILKVVSLLIYKNSTSTDIVEMYKVLGMENFTKIVMLFDGRTVKFPTKQEITNTLINSLVYYYREIKNLSWEDVKEKFPFEISGISCGIQFKQLENFLEQKINEIYKKIEEEK